MANSASFLDLPYEIRPGIIRLAILDSSREAPRDPSVFKSQERRKIEPEPKEGAESYDREALRVYFDANPTPNPALPFLLTNHQLHNETLDLLSTKAFTRALTYSLDVVYLKDMTFHPTWLSVPARASHIPELHVQFRIFNCPDDMRTAPSYNRDDELIMGSTGDNRLMFVFYHLLATILERGPCGQPITVGRVVMDFLPAEEEEDILPLALYEPSRIYDDVDPGLVDFFHWYLWNTRITNEEMGRPGVRAAAMLMGFVMAEVDLMKWMIMEVFEWGQVIYESIGKIECRLAGVPKAVGLAAGDLWQVPPWGGDHGSGCPCKRRWDAEFVPWREKVVARRVELGMPAAMGP